MDGAPGHVRQRHVDRHGQVVRRLPEQHAVRARAHAPAVVRDFVRRQQARIDGLRERVGVPCPQIELVERDEALRRFPARGLHIRRRDVDLHDALAGQPARVAQRGTDRQRAIRDVRLRVKHREARVTEAVTERE